MLAFITLAPPLEPENYSVTPFNAVSAFFKKIETRFNKIFFPRKYIVGLLPDLKDYLEKAVITQLRKEFESALQKKDPDIKKARSQSLKDKVQNFGIFLPGAVAHALSSAEDTQDSESIALSRAKLEQTLNDFTLDLLASFDHAIHLSDEEISSEGKREITSLKLEFERFIDHIQQNFKSSVSLDCRKQHGFLMGRPHSKLGINIELSAGFSNALSKGIQQFTPNMENPFYHQAYEFLKGRGHKSRSAQMPEIPVATRVYN